MSHLFKKITSTFFAIVLAVMSINLSGVLTVSTANAANEGTLKVHEKDTPANTESNDPKVCVFNFEGFGFDSNQAGMIVIDGQGQTPGTNLLSVPFTADASGDGETSPYINDTNSPYILANGHYKSTLYGKDLQGNYTIDLKAKSKVFKVECNFVTATAPTYTDPCGTANDSYTIPDTQNVAYKINGQVVTANTYPGTGSVTITAEAAAGYILQGTTSWTFNFTNVPCDTPVTANPPVKAVDECGTANDTYTIPTTTGVDYFVNNTLTVAGTYSTNGALSVDISAVAQAGYAIVGPTSWTLTFTDDACPIEVTPEVPTKIDECATDKDGYTIPSTTGVVYKVNGNTASAGFKSATGTVVITAEAVAGYVLTNYTGPWTFTFTDEVCPPEPCVPSLVPAAQLYQHYSSHK